MILGIPNSAIALALVRIAEEKNRIVMPTAAATSELTGKSCTAHSIHWIYDTYGQSKTIVNAISKMGGDNPWFFVTVDYAFGLAVEHDATTFIKAAGGKVAGLGAPSAEHRGLLLVPPAGAGLQGQGPDVRQRRQRHHQRHQAGGRVRPGQAGHEDQRPAGAVPRRAGRRPEGGAGPADLEPVLLGHDAGGARLHRPLHQGDRPAALLHPGRHLRGGAALPQGGAGRRHRRGQGRDGQDEGAADQRLHDQERPASARTAASSATCTSCRPRRPRNRRANGTW